MIPSGGPGRAQTTAEPAEVVSRTPTGGPWISDNRRSSISADGRFVEFDARPESNEVIVRDRVGNTTGPVPLVPSLNGSISDNGCVIAYTYGIPTNLGGGSFYNIFAFDRCTGLNLSVGAAVTTTAFGVPQATPNQDGSVIVWSTPSSPNLSAPSAINVATRSGNTYTQTAPIVAPRGAFEFGPRLAVSDDGNLIAAEAGPGSIVLVDRRSPASFETISVDANGNSVTGATDPSISGDGTLVTYTFQATNLTSVPPPSVQLRDRANNVTRLIAGPATSGEISRDGRYVTFLLRFGEIGEVYVARSTSSLPFESAEVDLVSYRDGDPATGTGGSASNPSISEHGRWVSFDSYAASLLVPGQGFDNTGTHVYVRQRRPAVTVDSIDFGTVGGPTNRQTTVRSDGMAGFVITAIDATGDFTVVDENCPTVLDPGSSCVVTVRFGASGEGQQTGVLTVRDESYPGVPLEGTGRLIGVAAPGDVGLEITPDPVQFDEVVVGTPAPQRAATVTNTGDITVTIDAVSLSGTAAGDYSVATDGCTGTTLAAGDSCDLGVGFVATQAGTRVANLNVSGSDGASAAAGLRGSGRFGAELMVTPEAAAGGQVVTVLGAGFPPSTTVDIVLGEASAVQVDTDATGSFMLSWLILSGTPQGELLADDVAVDSYDAEPAQLLVVGTPMRPQATATLSRTVRSHVSR